MTRLPGTGIEIVETVNIIDFSWQGHASWHIEPLRRSVSQICRAGRGVSHFYIGIASGPDFSFALSRRVDERKRLWGCTEIWNLYQSRSGRSVRRLEADLVEYYRSDPRFMNVAQGGGGRQSEQPWHYLYLAFRRQSER